MPFQISDAEADTLRTSGLSNEARVLYLLELRPHMDYSTGLVGGPKRRISLQQLREGAEVRRRPGSTKPDYLPSIEDVRWMLEELKRLGLIEPQPKTRRTDPMVFRLPLAVVGERGNCAQKEEPQRNPKGATPKENPIPARLSEQENPKGTPKGEPHTSGYPVETIPYRTSPGRAREDGEAPETPQAWIDFFLHHGFQLHQVQTVPLITAAKQWCEQGATVGDMRVAMAAAHAKLGRTPDTPSYYRNFLADVLHAKTLPPASRPAAPGGHHAPHQPVDNSLVARVRRANGAPEPECAGRVIEGQFHRT